MRVQPCNAAPIGRGDFVLYWMIAARRTTYSHALDHAIARARELARPLLVVEALRCGYRWASDRIHAFVLQGMADNARAFAAASITYLPYVEPEPGRGSGLLETLAQRACLVVTDEQPGFFLPRMIAALAPRLAVPLETVDGNGVLPLRAADRGFPTAVAFRRHFQRVAAPHLAALPAARPLARLPATLRDAAIPGAVLRRWPSASAALLACEPEALARLPVDHSVRPVSHRGGSAAAASAVRTFLSERLDRYDQRNHPDAHAASGLSPYLHFGHVGAHEVVHRTLAHAGWDPSRLATRATGFREGWWGAPPVVEAFLDELVTWRELAYGYCFHRRDHARYGTLPVWARATLDKHLRDPRPHLYTRAQLAAAATGDTIWNAAQRELLTDGRIHNYLRMLWGKKILEWSRTPRAALATLIELNNRYAVDGRDPCSYAGILWCLGLFDRPWGERAIFGTVRYMSSDATRKKLDLADYLSSWSGRRST